MNWYELELKPRDVLFFRDARPMDGAQIGYGGRWPTPGVWHQALLSAFHRRWPEVQPWERVEPKDRHPSAGTGRFGSLVSVGVFPHLPEEGILVPTPADLGASGDLARLMKPLGVSNLPPCLKYTVARVGPPSKETPKPWVSLSGLQSYLEGAPCGTLGNDRVFTTELRPGIGIDPASHANVGGQFFMAEYLRLLDDVSLVGFARCTQKQNGQQTDVLQQWLGEGHPALVLGGQGGLVHLNGRREKLERPPLSLTSGAKSRLIKWVLLTPASFAQGWLPNWVRVEDGVVRLKSGDTERKVGEDRKTWRERVRKFPEINARLVAVRLNGPEYVSGWNSVNASPADGEESRSARDQRREQKIGPKPTVALVPAGSVYYFEADSDAAAHELEQALTGRPRSDSWGEKGFGVGVCGTWASPVDIGRLKGEADAH